MITSIGPTIGSSVEGAIRSAAVALNRPISSFVIYASSAQGHGGMSSIAIRCWRFAVRSIMAPLTGYLNVINSVCKKRKNHRMLLFYGFPIHSIPGFKFARWHHLAQTVDDPATMDCDCHPEDEALL